MEFYKFIVANFEILLFGYFMNGKVPKKAAILDSGHKLAKKQNFRLYLPRSCKRIFKPLAYLYKP